MTTNVSSSFELRIKFTGKNLESEIWKSFDFTKFLQIFSLQNFEFYSINDVIYNNNKHKIADEFSAARLSEIS